jgi:hypothetical protein
MKAIKHLVRTISANPNAVIGTDSVVDVEKELAVYFEGGWDLFRVEAIGMAAGNVTMLYVLVKESAPIIPAGLVVEEAPKAKRGRPAKDVELTVEVA